MTFVDVGGLGTGETEGNRMRKREVEKLLYHAVAEALGIETNEPKKTEAKTAVPAMKIPQHSDDNRAAA
jgi:hypothetical protein